MIDYIGHQTNALESRGFHFQTDVQILLPFPFPPVLPDLIDFRLHYHLVLQDHFTIVANLYNLNNGPECERNKNTEISSFSFYFQHLYMSSFNFNYRFTQIENVFVALQSIATNLRCEMNYWYCLHWRWYYLVWAYFDMHRLFRSPKMLSFFVNFSSFASHCSLTSVDNRQTEKCDIWFIKLRYIIWSDFIFILSDDFELVLNAMNKLHWIKLLQLTSVIWGSLRKRKIGRPTEKLFAICGNWVL